MDYWTCDGLLDMLRASARLFKTTGNAGAARCCTAVDCNVPCHHLISYKRQITSCSLLLASLVDANIILSFEFINLLHLSGLISQRNCYVYNFGTTLLAATPAPCSAGSLSACAPCVTPPHTTSPPCCQPPHTAHHLPAATRAATTLKYRPLLAVRSLLTLLAVRSLLKTPPTVGHHVSVSSPLFGAKEREA